MHDNAITSQRASDSDSLYIYEAMEQFTPEQLALFTRLLTAIHSKDIQALEAIKQESPDNSQSAINEIIRSVKP